MPQRNGVLPGVEEMAGLPLADGDDLFRVAFDNAPIGMAVANPDLTSIQFNPALREMLGVTEEEILASGLWAYTHAEDVLPDLVAMQRVLAGEIDAYELEKRYLHRDGHVVWGHLRGTLVRDRAGRPRYFISQIQDVTARKAADEALAASEARFRLAFENAPIGIALVGLDLRPLQVNRALCAMLGYNEAELLNTTLRDLTHPEDIPANQALVDHALAGELDSFSLEKRYLRADGSILWAFLTSSFVRDDRGAPLYLISQIQDISARKAAEAEHAETQQGTRQVLERIRDGFYTLDREWRFSYINAAAERIFGRPRSDLLGKRIWTEFASAIETPAYEVYHRALAEGVPVEVEFFYPAFAAWYQVDAYPSEDGLAVFFRDVTERWRLVQELRASETKFRTLVEQIPAVVYLLAADEAQTRLYFSPYLETLTGYTPDEALTGEEFWLACVHPEDRARIWPLAEESADKAEPFREEYRHRRKDGTYIWIRDECVPIYDEAGTLVAWQGLLMDISDRVQAEEAQARFAALVDSAVEAIISIDLDATIISWNRGAELLYGYDAGEIVGQPSTRLFPEGVVDPVREGRLAAARAGLPVDPFESVRRRKDGSLFTAAISLSQIHDRNGVLIGFSAITRDITVRRQAEAALQAALDAAQAASRAKSAFLAMMSHELRTPLQAVIGYSEFLLAGSKESLTAEQREDVGYIHQGGHRMMALIGQLLDLSRIEAGALHVSRDRVDLLAILEQVRQDVAPLAEGKGLTLTIEAPPSLPAVLGDELRLRQILLNLAGNAVKFTERGAVRVRAAVAEGSVAVEVQDTGIGIPPEALPHIFEEFRQVDSSLTRRHGGAGLGLAISQKLAELMGSRIMVESRVGKGSTFSLRLPTAPPGRLRSRVMG